MEPTPEPLNPSGENTVRQESEDDHQLILDTFSILFFLLGCLNPVVLLVVLFTVFFGKKKLRGRWLAICGLVGGLVAGGFFNAVSLYLTPVLEITELMRGNMVKLMHGASADSIYRGGEPHPLSLLFAIVAVSTGNNAICRSQCARNYHLKAQNQ